MDIGLLIVMIILLCINVITMGYIFFVLDYNKRGIVFLKYVRKQISDNDDDSTNGTAIQRDITIFVNTVALLKSRISLSLFILNVNVAMLSFAFFPVLLVTNAWSTMSVIGAICNAFMFSMFITTSKTKNKIDATCIPYNTLLSAYGYERETEKDNDSTS